MARPRTGSELTVSQLENLLAARKSDLELLLKERGKLQKQMETIDEKIARLGGGAASNGSGVRARNSMSLVDAISQVLTKSSEPMGVGEIVNGVQSVGYRSTSANFRGIVNQTLIKERKQFLSTSRGMYQIKK